MITDTLQVAKPTREWIHIILVANSSRRQENFMALLRSIPNSPTITCVHSPDQCLGVIHAHLPMLIILDHAFEVPSLAETVASIHQRNRKAHILLLVTHPRETIPNLYPRPNAVLYDGFSFSTLMEEVRKTITAG